MNLTPEQLDIVDKTLAIYRNTVAELQNRLSSSVLEGTPYLILADCEDLELVLGSFDPEQMWPTYKANVPLSFRSLLIMPSNLCGCSMYDEEGAARVIAKCKADSRGSALTYFRARHVRDEQRRRLESALACIARFEKAKSNTTG